ncbi:MAG: hypothetical protein IPJ69_00140 [Deltaproteobacteria bacterium]|nr:MAG: hypothetical protein IPJ69_00140 [Deltaproteobacteria bacterium]
MSSEEENSEIVARRKDLQLGRRFFHMAGGLGVVLIYGLFFTHTQIVQFLGVTACVLYIFDRSRVVYPEIARKFEKMTRFFLRAEERLQESTMIPYIMAILLTVISFPKPMGIRYGRRHLVPDKTLEGSLAFLITTFLCSVGVLFYMTHAEPWRIVISSFILSVLGTCFEMLPLKLDDNLTIPLFIGFTGWALCYLMGISNL